DVYKRQLLANSTAAQEGHELWLGVYVKLRPEWHIYWEYPGESGFATKVEWDLSEIGTTSSTTLFPIPSRFVGAGGVISYGYAGETLLMTRTTAVHLKPAAQKVTLRAKTRWLMCREDECRDGRETLEITLPVGTPQPANTELFERYERLVPQDSVPPNVKWNWLTKEGGIIVEIDVLPPSRGNLLAEDCAQGRGLAFFPLPPKGLLADIPEISGPTRKMLVGKDNQQITVFTGKATVKLPLKRTSRATTGALTLGGVLVQQPVEEDGTVGELVANRLLIPIP
ncbi:MAG: protein-disulfide reductase DsbD family protein, partial [Candidatus Sumerlaeaceae bacterium]|nr:protein-disulfide reductase DsbD family protein [Candidatus Sumerlaeaceae bacterium]